MSTSFYYFLYLAFSLSGSLQFKFFSCYRLIFFGSTMKFLAKELLKTVFRAFDDYEGIELQWNRESFFNSQQLELKKAIMEFLPIIASITQLVVSLLFKRCFNSCLFCSLYMHNKHMV
ncbi:uncharacterized protein LOC114316472 [Camellia sinensis]|uniref:uncharacterized protein LOC114316472 n=1 Tax=Camellia sinensis TaxID=4442 RepID=UPI0010358D8D|nr:uncharacterized protein LOC114316472 [Camellia sinensis]